VRLRIQAERAPSRSRSARAKPPVGDDGTPLSLAERDCLDALKAWRAGVAKEHNLPAYVIFHDATLRAIAQRRPTDVADLDGISGIGHKKRAAYGDAVIQVVSAFL
jgi:ATP-dependent DNA helicase RecQ